MTTETAPSRILIVDDEPLNLDLIEQELEDRGYEVELAGDGREALERVQARHPDLILLDVIMPRLDGIETCHILKSDPETALIPIIMMTALTAVEDRIRGIEAGADDFLSKPVDDRELMARIETALRTKRAVDRTVHELQSAADQLAAVGRVDRDATIVVAAADDLDRIRAAFSSGDGHEVEGTERLLRWIFVDPDPRGHAISAVKTAAEIVEGTEAIVALESGSALVNPERVEEGGGPRWLTAAVGPAADTAHSIVGLGQPGQAVIGPEAARRLEGLVELAPLPGSDARLLAAAPDPLPVATSGEAISWPAEYQSVLDPLREAWRVAGPIYLTRSLSGKSGARVYSVDITTGEFSGQAILKLDEAPRADWDEHDEARRHIRALETNPGYGSQHLPRVVHALVHDGAAATLSSIAGRGLEYVLPWAHVDYERQVDSAANISRGILGDWNHHHELSELISPSQLLTAWLDYRLDPEAGRITRFLDSRGIEATAPSFVYEGLWYPNPYSFAVAAHPVPSRTSLRAACGSIHGDFHGFNVLMHATGDLGAYYVIDLAFYAEDAYLMFDNAYFELAHLLHTRGSAPGSRWVGVVESAQTGGVPSGDDYGLIQIVRAIRTGVRRWIDESEPNRLAYMESQHVLARVAAGLNFVNKRVADHMKLLSLLYAAANLKSYLEFQAIDWPRVGPTLEG